MKIIVIDDEQPIRETLELYALSMGHDCILYEDGASAIEQIKALDQKADLILCDFNMPNLNGAQVTQKLIQIGIDIPIIGMSGKPENKKSFMDAGAKAFLEKPFDIEALEKLLNEIK